LSTSNLASTARGPGGEADAQTQYDALTKRIEGIAQAWHPDSPECRFQVCSSLRSLIMTTLSLAY
jgi:nuclear pore complex protein Nup54